MKYKVRHITSKISVNVLFYCIYLALRGLLRLFDSAGSEYLALYFYMK